MMRTQRVIEPMDKFHIPRKMIPNGVNYQWVDKEFMQTCLDSGWIGVPYERHRDWFPAVYCQPDNSIQIDRVTLMEKLSEEVKAARQREIELAYENEEKQLRKIDLIVHEANTAFNDVKAVAKVKAGPPGSR